MFGDLSQLLKKVSMCSVDSMGFRHATKLVEVVIRVVRVIVMIHLRKVGRWREGGNLS